jgi:multidrug resistance efflux pump
VITAFSTISLRKTATEAYITGDVIQIRSPMQGKVVDEPLGTGEMFGAGHVLVKVAAGRDEEAKHESARLTLKRIKSEILDAESKLESLIKANRMRLRNDLATAQKELMDLKGMEDRYQFQVKRYRMLVRLGALDVESLAGSEATLNSYRQRRENQDRIVSDLGNEIADADSKANSQIMQLPIPSKRLEILEIKIIEIAQQLNELKAREQEVLRVMQNNQKRKYFVYQPWFNGIVLSNRTATASEVNENEILMTIANCDRLKIEAQFEANRLINKEVGDLAMIKLGNDKTIHRGKIISIRGVRSIRTLESPDAASFKPTTEDRMRVQISVPREFSQRECRPGERVEVSL